MTDTPDVEEIAAARSQLIAVLEQSGPPAASAYVAGAVAALAWVLGESAALAPGDHVGHDRLRGGATAVGNGLTYGISGRESIHDTIRGYAKIANIILDPVQDANPSMMPFVSRVEADCTQGMKGH